MQSFQSDQSTKSELQTANSVVRPLHITIFITDTWPRNSSHDSHKHVDTTQYIPPPDKATRQALPSTTITQIITTPLTTANVLVHKVTSNNKKALKNRLPLPWQQYIFMLIEITLMFMMTDVLYGCALWALCSRRFTLPHVPSTSLPGRRVWRGISTLKGELKWVWSCIWSQWIQQNRNTFIKGWNI